MLPRAVISLVLLLALTAGLSVSALAETLYPKPIDYIADDAAILSESTVREIKEKNDTLISEVKAVIAVCTVKTTSGVDIGKYARSVYTEWKLPAGVLILIASEDNAFYLVQSSSIGEKITNEDLEGIRDREIEEDFAAGNVDRAVRKAVSQLSILMLKELKTEDEAAADASPNAAANAESGSTAEEKTAPSAGSVIVKVLKFVLIVVLVLVIAFVLLFIAALFNDDVAAFMQRTFFRRGNHQGNTAPAYYDDRLYNGGQQQNRPRQPQQGQYQQYPQQYPNQNQAVQRRQYPQNQVPRQQYPYPPQQVQQVPQNQTYYNQQGQYPRQAAPQVSPQAGQNQRYGNIPIQNMPVQNRGQYAQNPQYAQQQPVRQVYPRQARQNRPAPQAQPYSAENDPNVIRQKQAQGDPSATQTYTIPGRGNY